MKDRETIVFELVLDDDIRGHEDREGDGTEEEVLVDVAPEKCLKMSLRTKAKILLNTSCEISGS